MIKLYLVKETCNDALVAIFMEHDDCLRFINGEPTLYYDEVSFGGIFSDG